MKKEAPTRPLLLCFYADGPYWDNLIRIPSLATGYSTARPFRYRDVWIAPEVLSAIRDTPQALDDRRALLCIRFSSAGFERTIVPVRLATIRHIDRQPDQTCVYFTAGHFFNFPSADLAAASRQVDVPPDSPMCRHLMLECPESLDLEDFAKDEESDTRLWSQFVDMVSAPSSLPVSKQVSSALFFHTNGVRTKKPVVASRLGTLFDGNPTFGAKLVEGKVYDLRFVHRIRPLNTKDGLKTSRLELSVSTNGVELARTAEEISGNYQTHTLQLTAKEATSASFTLEFAVKDHQVELQSGSKVNTAPFFVPMRVRVSYLYRFLKVWLWVVLLAFALAVQSLVQRWADDKPLSSIAIAIAIISAAVVTGLLTQIAKTKS